MTFTRRITLALAVVGLVPLALLGLVVRREMTARLTAQADGRALATARAIRTRLDQDVAAIRGRLRTLAADLANDNRFRVEATGGGDRSWVLDWAGDAMRTTGLGILVLQDSAGRIRSSGQFRNDYDRLLPALPAVVARAAGGALVVARTPDSTVLALAAIDSFTVRGRRFTLVGGRELDPTRLASPGRDDEIGLALLVPGGGTLANAVDEITLPYLDTRAGAAPATASLVVTRDPGPVAALRRQVDRFVLIGLALTLALVIAAALWLGGLIARPLAQLAATTERLDLDQLDQPFATDRADEVGTLARVLAAMAGRLRRSTIRLREAERKAALGDLARQINHDVKNGLVPIRNVVRHLTGVALAEPEKLGAVYRERRGTLESSIEYLDGLAQSYARLAPASERAADLNRVAEETARSLPDTGVAIECRLEPAIPPVRADGLALRRVAENLITNALDAALAGGRTVTISTSLAGEPLERRAVLAIRDSGPGMSQEELDRAFLDFHTTKPNGTGLGLTVVRRLVADFGGTLRVETAPGRGSTFTVEIPVA